MPTIKRNGDWAVELTEPLVLGQQIIKVLNIARPSMDHTIRWLSGQIPSSLALLSELSGVPETALRSLRSPDSERLMLAFFNILPPPLQEDFKNGAKPLATADAGSSVAAPPSDAPFIPPTEHESDPADPRFPKIDGPVVPLREPVPREVEEMDDALGLRSEEPGVRRVG